MRIRTVLDNIAQEKNHSKIVFLLLALGILVRLIGISIAPAGLNQDEASIGYEAYSILTTGFDRNGNSYPIHLVAWGSGQNALYAYLSIPFIQIFGLNVFSVRLVNAIFSCLSLIVFYSIFKNTFNRSKAIVALAILSINPWSIMAARWGLESNIFPSLFLAGVWLMTKGIQSSQKYLIPSFLLFAISLYSYGTSYLILPIFFVLSLPYLLYHNKISIKYLLISSSVFLTVALPIILFVIINHFGFPTIHIGDITIPKLEDNRTTIIFNLFNHDFFQNLGKNIIRFFNLFFLQTDGNEYNAIPVFGTIYQISTPFLIVGLFNRIKNKSLKKEPIHYIFCVWLICSVVLGITSNVNVNRLNIIFFPMLYFVVFGIFDVYSMLKPEFQKQYKQLILGLYTLLFILFIGYYFVVFNEKIKSDFSYGLGEAIQNVRKQSNGGTIHITNKSINMPYIFACFYDCVNPEIFYKTRVFFPSNVSDFKNVKQFQGYSFGTNYLTTDSVYILSNEELECKEFEIIEGQKHGNYTVVKASDLKYNR
jgi:4-amino-4-deoxy-L-arabinose transferase-like glycosyltransferase